jgi:hypothetical protein
MPEEDSVLIKPPMAAMADSKPLWKSTTFIGVIIMVLAQVAALFGYQFSADDISALTENTDVLVSAGGTAIGAALAIWGRVRATKRIGSSGTR